MRPRYADIDWCGKRRRASVRTNHNTLVTRSLWLFADNATDGDGFSPVGCIMYWLAVWLCVALGLVLAPCRVVSKVPQARPTCPSGVGHIATPCGADAITTPAGALTAATASVDMIEHLDSKMQGRDEQHSPPRDASSAARSTLGVTVNPDPSDLTMQAAVHIQARTRCYLAEIHLGAAIDSAVCIQGYWRAWRLTILECALLVHKWRAASSIQAVVRRRIVWRPLIELLWRDRDDFTFPTADGELDVMDPSQVLVALKQERRGIVRIQAATRGYRVRAELRRPPLAALRAALGAAKLSSVLYLCTMVARGFLGCFVVDRAGRNESLDELAKRHGGTAKKASSAKKQRARKVHMVMTSSNSKIITTTRGDIICVAGPGAVDQAFLNKAVSRGRLVLSAVDRVMLQLSWADVEADSDDEKSNCHNSMAAHAVMRGEAAAHAVMRGAGA